MRKLILFMAVGLASSGARDDVERHGSTPTPRAEKQTTTRSSMTESSAPAHPELARGGSSNGTTGRLRTSSELKTDRRVEQAPRTARASPRESVGGFAVHGEFAMRSARRTDGLQPGPLDAGVRVLTVR